MESATSTPAPATPAKHANLRYLGLRTLLLIAVGAVAYLLGLRGVWLIIVAFLGSGLISLFALARQRNDAAGNLESALSKVNRRIDRAAAAEDQDELPAPGSDPAVGVQPAGEQVHAEEVDYEGGEPDKS